MDWSVFVDALPAVASALAVPVVTVIKNVSRAVSKEVPDAAKAPLAILLGAVISAFTGVDPVTGAGVAAIAVKGRDVVKGR